MRRGKSIRKRATRKSETPQGKLVRIGGLIEQIEKDRVRAIAGTSHLGGGATVLTPCRTDLECRRCEIETHYERRLGRVAKLRERALVELYQVGVRGLERARAARQGKITMAAYEAARRKARTRKELRSLLGVSFPGLRKWEKANKIRET